MAADLYPGRVYRACMWRPAVILLVAVLLCSAGCVAPALREPTITLSGVAVEKIAPGSIDLSLRLVVDNPNPVGATLARVSFDVYFFNDGQWVFLAHAEQEGIAIRPGGKTPVTIPVTVDNLGLVQGLLRGLADGEVTLRVSGSGVVDYSVATFEVPFDRTVEVRPGQA
ncbi:LEA type 2 family protein [Methanoculleus sp.]|uniref:LEA type 2 family protein n=1 Tax=Methanoculleus sp. TaxID=90427 RepID=UPI001BD5776E